MRIVDDRASKAGNPRRQTLLLSATLGPELQSLADLSLQQPTLVGLEQPHNTGTSHLGGVAVLLSVCSDLSHCLVHGVDIASC